MAGSRIEESLLSFAIDLHKKLLPSEDKHENVFYSPFSISVALSMVFAGARSDTAKQISDALHTKGNESLHKQFSDTLSKVLRYGPDVELRVANRVVLDASFPILDTYVDLLKHAYSSSVSVVDFENDFEKARIEVNNWVEQATASKIKNLLVSGSLDALTVLVLVNAVYFKGEWKTPFLHQVTEPWDFRVDSSRTTRVEMMYQEDDFRMSRCDDLNVTALEIPYRGGKVSMVVLLPDDLGGLRHLEENLSAIKLRELLNNLSMKNDVRLRLPKFKLEHSIDLEVALKALGINTVFTPDADLAGISMVKKLRVSKIVHKAFVEIDEVGTEASAATAVDFCYECLAEEIVEFIVDRPFMLLIRCHDPDVVLFVGSVRNP